MSFLLYFIFFSVEVVSLLLLLSPVSWHWSITVVIHVFISLIASLWVSRNYTHKYIGKKKAWISLSFFIFFSPVIGIVILWLLSLQNNLRMRQKQNSSVSTEDFDQNSFSYLTETKLLSSANKIKKTHALLSTLNDENYLNLLIASRHLPDKVAYSLLQEALSCPFESARLMAFSLKEKLEHRLQNILQHNLNLLKTLPQDRLAEQHLLLAKNYLSLLDIGVLFYSEEELLQQAKYHCIKAISIKKKSAKAYKILSEIFYFQGMITQSRRASKIAFSFNQC